MESFSPLLNSIPIMIAPILGGIIIVAALCLISLKLSKHSFIKGQVSFIIALSFLGGIMGVIAGGSSSPLGQTLITGVLGLVSALLTYLLSKEALRDWKVLMPSAMVALIVSAFIGLTIGANYKVLREQHLVNMQKSQKLFEAVILPICLKELELRLQGIPEPESYYSQCPQK
ncbi:hypothetical protein [Pseudomonas chlororaphis]|uniref:hypothetical protein n=1 Tax=Pseudomonas chlororaphis TaxID=587753 RepID=UPI000F571D04|nr:hypothetical protein [Pseudomonas chlororaphis]QIT24197.1 hypothetical protein HCN09_21625 [Pseudomonas chlororaphis subsp. aurantiaca]WDH02308.1 hypothetical protein PUP57_22755 [Pseudomonas chlororaphis]WDH08844.1 hypothetical protein PUP64_24255 [Pseudomonas chlororaphis]